MQFKSIDVHSWLKNNMFWTYYSVIKAIIPSIKYVEHNIPLADCWTEVTNRYHYKKDTS